jgi:hypothetical protein
MQNDKNNGFLGARFEGLTAAPSENLWGSIAGQLDTEENKKKGLFWWWSTGLAAVLVIGFISWHKWSVTPDYSLSISGKSSVSQLNEWSAHSLNEVALNQDDQQLVEQNQEELTVPEDVMTPAKHWRQTSKGIIGTVEDKNRDFNHASDIVPELKEKIILLPLQSPQPIEINNHSKSKIAAVEIGGLQNISRWEWGLQVNSWHSVRQNWTAQEYDVVEGSSFLPTSINPELIRANRFVGIGGYLGYNWKPRLRFYGELNMEQTRYRIVGDGLSTLAVNDPQPIFNELNLLSATLPIGAEFEFLQKRRFQMGVGVHLLNEITFRQRMMENVEATAVEASSQNIEWMAKYRSAIGLHLNINYQLNSKMRVQFKPGIRQYLTKKSPSTIDVPQRQFWWGGSVGLVWSF